MSNLIDQTKTKHIDARPIIDAILSGEFNRFELLDKVITTWPIEANVDFTVPKDNYQ